MASKYEIITALYRESVKGLAKNHHTWTAFLQSACYNYRLPFDEQVLIHAQRPDATAVLEIEGKNGWNQKFGRWVNRYATGIAVFDRNHAGRQRLKYYFDISDTHESRFARPVPIWEYKPEYEAAVIEALENRFGELRDKSDLQSALHSVAKNAVEDNLPDYLSELIRYRADSFLEDYDDLNVEVIYRRLLENSVAYMLMSRCGLDADEYFEVVAYNRWENKHAEEIAQDLLNDVQSVIDEFPTEQTVPDDTKKSPAEMATVKVDGYDCIGILSVPVLDLELPVLTDWSYAKLKKAPCHYYGTYYEKDFVIAAHNYKSHFGRLSELQAGDIVVFTDINNIEHYYEVVLLETLPKNATKEMITSGFDLSLYTCTPGGSNRVTVRCNAAQDSNR